MSNTHLNVAKVCKDDEFYTPYECSSYILEEVVATYKSSEELKSTLFIYPCDSEEQNSQFLDASKKYELQTIAFNHMEDLLTYNFENDNLQIITNPPFSKLGLFLEILTKLKERYPKLKYTFISPIVVGSGVFKTYYKDLYFYPLKFRQFYHNGELEGIAAMLVSNIALSIDNPPDFLDNTFTYFKYTNEAKKAVLMHLTKDYFYTTRAAIVAQQYFKEFGYKIDFESGYNTQLRKQGLGLNFGMIKWVKE